jgi:hypothetical protein
MDGPPTAPFWPDGYPARPGLGLSLTPLLGYPATSPGHAGVRVHLIPINSSSKHVLLIGTNVMQRHLESKHIRGNPKAYVCVLNSPRS